MPFAQFLQGARPFSYTHLVLPLRQRTQAPPALRAVDRTTPEDIVGEATSVAGKLEGTRKGEKKKERGGEWEKACDSSQTLVTLLRSAAGSAS